MYKEFKLWDRKEWRHCVKRKERKTRQAKITGNGEREIHKTWINEVMKTIKQINNEKIENEKRGKREMKKSWSVHSSEIYDTRQKLITRFADM